MQDVWVILFTKINKRKNKLYSSLFRSRSMQNLPRRESDRAQKAVQGTKTFRNPHRHSFIQIGRMQQLIIIIY